VHSFFHRTHATKENVFVEVHISLTLKRDCISANSFENSFRKNNDLTPTYMLDSESLLTLLQYFGFMIAQLLSGSYRWKMYWSFQFIKTAILTK
jgi:hypothetical protein